MPAEVRETEQTQLGRVGILHITGTTGLDLNCKGSAGNQKPVLPNQSALTANTWLEEERGLGVTSVSKESDVED